MAPHSAGVGHQGHQQHSKEWCLCAMAIKSHFSNTNLVESAVPYPFQILYHHHSHPHKSVPCCASSQDQLTLESQEYVCLRTAQEMKRERKNIIHAV